MATERNLPIKFFQKREIDESGTEAGGGGAMPKWINEDNVPQKSIYFREVLQSVDHVLAQKVKKNNFIPTVVKIKMNEEALAKRFRKEIAAIFNVDKKLNIIGVNLGKSY